MTANLHPAYLENRTRRVSREQIKWTPINYFETIKLYAISSKKNDHLASLQLLIAVATAHADFWRSGLSHHAATVGVRFIVR